MTKDILKKGWEEYIIKDRVQSFIIVMSLFTILFLAGKIPLEFYEKVTTFNIAGVFGADAADNITNFIKK